MGFFPAKYQSWLKYHKIGTKVVDGCLKHVYKCRAPDCAKPYFVNVNDTDAAWSFFSHCLLSDKATSGGHPLQYEANKKHVDRYNDQWALESASQQKSRKKRKTV